MEVLLFEVGRNRLLTVVIPFSELKFHIYIHTYLFIYLHCCLYILAQFLLWGKSISYVIIKKKEKKSVEINASSTIVLLQTEKEGLQGAN